jgi:lysophospholipid acyltransferase (LPLAT)-like uncharacterized protein
LLGLWARTWRIEYLGRENLQAVLDRGHKGHFMTLWHGRMILALPSHARFRWHVLVSRSGDGDVSQELLKGFGYRVVRGSSSRGGARAVREMLRVLEGGSVLILTPDGPRGPAHSVNPGIAWMVRATGHPVVPCGVVCDRAWHARSWDRFTIPRLRARVVVIYGTPLWVERDATEEDMQRVTERIREEMLAAERRGFDRLGLEPDW